MHMFVGWGWGLMVLTLGIFTVGLVGSAKILRVPLTGRILLTTTSALVLGMVAFLPTPGTTHSKTVLCSIYLALVCCGSLSSSRNHPHDQQSPAGL